MSIVLSVYGQNAFKEYVLPAIHNAETILVLERRIFNLREDWELHLEVVDQQWSFLASSTCLIKRKEEGEMSYRLEHKANFHLESNNGEKLFTIVQMKDTSFVAYEKYDISAVREITIGSHPDRAISYQYQYSGLQYISQKHGMIRLTRQGATLEDTSKNGIFVNDARVRGTHPLTFGDRIHIWGLDMVFLDTVLAVRMDLEVTVDHEVLNLWMPTEGPTADPKHPPVLHQIYHRAPRTMEVIETGTMEIEPPPTPREIDELPLMMAIGPAMTMAIPMLMSTTIAIIGARSTGSHAGIFMYTGMITAISSAGIGVIWALNNIRYQRKRVKKEENRRFEAYGEYLITCADEIKKKYDHNTSALKRMYPSADVCVSGKLMTDNLLWGRNSTHPDFLSYRLGLSDIPFQMTIDIPKERFTLINDSLADKPRFIQDSYKLLHQVPICLDLLKERQVGLIGGPDKADAYPVAYALAAQIASQNSYTDVKIGFIYQEEQGAKKSKWEFAKWLPHVWSQDRKVRFVAAGRNEASDVFYELTKVFRVRNEEMTGHSRDLNIHKPHYILFMEDQSCLEGELIAKYLFDKEKNFGLTVILMAEGYENLPNSCECIIQNDDQFKGWYNTRTGERTAITFDLIGQDAIEHMARELSGVEVNEVEVGGEIPNSISFFEMYGVSSLNDFQVAERWKKNRTYENMKALIGQKAGGVPCYLDVHEKYHGPHGLVAGTTGSGKSETLQTYMLSLALNFSPDDVGFFIIDYKGGGMANLFDGLPHILGQISNLSGNQVGRAMVSIKSENKRRQRVFTEHGVNNINAYTTLYKNGEAAMPVPHLFIIIDEFAELKREESDFMKELISVAQVGRSLGVHLILATQKPAGTVDDNIWSNSKFRICLRVQDRQDSTDMLHKPDAAYLTQAGRGYLQVGNDELYELFQSGWSGAVYESDADQVHQTLATLIANTGKADVIGNHVKRGLKELQQQRWLIRLGTYFTDAVDEWNRSVSGGLHPGFTREQFIEETLFDQMMEDGLDFPANEYNIKALQHFIALYDQAVTTGCDSDEAIARYMIGAASAAGIKLPELKDITQLDAVVQYLADVAVAEGYQQSPKLWLPVLPETMVLTDLEGYEADVLSDQTWPVYPDRWELQATIGLLDDPSHQAQMPLTLNFTEHGHHAVCGISMSGKSVLIQTIIYDLIHRYSPDYLSVYMIDFSNRMFEGLAMAPHVGGILYESDLDTIGKFFHMIEVMVQERKQLFRGGNYHQYVMTHGVSHPAVLVVIDNVAGFREKTDFQYDDILMQLSRECAAYGIYFLLSGGGFNSTEIPSRIKDNIHRVICLEMTDRFQYADCLNTMQISVIPESGIHGRGIALVGGETLEFQAALSLAAADDYTRSELIKTQSRQLLDQWQGRTARAIPKIPEKPVWAEFAALERVVSLADQNAALPLGYNLETAEIYAVNLARTYCYIVSGKARTGKTNTLKAMIHSAAMKSGEITVVDIAGAELKRTAEEVSAVYIQDYEAYKNFLTGLIPVFQVRNQMKKDCLAKGMEEAEIYEFMQRETPYYIFIGDLAAFTKALHDEQGVKDNLCGAMGNLFEKGFLHNIYFFAGLNQDQRMELAGMTVYETFTATKAGLHLGGKTTDQRLFDFGEMPYAEQSAVLKPGIAAVPATEHESYVKVVIPLVKGNNAG